MTTHLLSASQIKAEALRLGFSVCGIAPAKAVEDSAATAFRRWLSENKQADMSYMANHLEKRLDPTLLMEGTQSIICVALNYYPAERIKDDQYQLAWYAYGKDYHDLVKAKLTALQTYIDAQSPHPVQSRVFCDTAPILERYWAERAGLGWIGKHTQLIIPRAGSCFFLGELFIDKAVDQYDQPQKKRCGSCTRCLDACPANALEAPYLLNSKRCLSYLTIEHRGYIPPSEGKRMEKMIYGCDECQKACPWNRFSVPCTIPELQPSKELLNMRKEDWQTLTEDQYRILFKGSAVKRAKYAGLMRNVKLVVNE